jgi:hypothetical protein
MSDVFGGLISADSETKFYEGAGIFESVSGTVDSVVEGNLAAAGGNLVATGLASLGTIMDPLQTLFAAGVGWAMEHVDALREPLDRLMGNPKAIEGQANSWKRVEKRIYEITDLFVAQVRSTAVNWTAESATAYRLRAHDHAETIQAMGAIADGLGRSTTTLGAVVGIARNTIRDIIAQVVGAILSKLLQATTAVLLPKALVDVAILVASTSRRILKVITELLAKIAEIGRGVTKLRVLMERLGNRVMTTSKATNNVSILLGFRVEAAALARQGLSGPFKAYGVLSRGDFSVHGPLRQVLINTGRAASQSNSSQNSGAAADNLRDFDAEPSPIDLQG